MLEFCASRSIPHSSGDVKAGPPNVKAGALDMLHVLRLAVLRICGRYLPAHYGLVHGTVWAEAEVGVLVICGALLWVFW